ncbi:MAG TPA: nitrile hydratase subunit alpha, partial [Longimicrobiaceae bacterium]|nr:nitrile hydratase subunit alpha [Longimicrobiaceae bacterium]
MLVADKERTLLALVTARAWRDGWYRQRLLNDAAAVLAEEGVEIPEGVTLAVLEDTDRVKHVVVPEGAAEAQLARVRAFLPLQPGCELRLVATSRQARFLVLPVHPAGVPYGASDLELLADGGTDITSLQSAQLVTVESEVVDVATNAVNVELASESSSVNAVQVELVS